MQPIAVRTAPAKRKYNTGSGSNFSDSQPNWNPPTAAVI
jgi:hypothetical protein